MASVDEFPMGRFVVPSSDPRVLLSVAKQLEGLRDQSLLNLDLVVLEKGVDHATADRELQDLHEACALNQSVVRVIVESNDRD